MAWAKSTGKKIGKFQGGRWATRVNEKRLSSRGTQICRQTGRMCTCAVHYAVSITIYFLSAVALGIVLSRRQSGTNVFSSEYRAANRETERERVRQSKISFNLLAVFPFLLQDWICMETNERASVAAGKRESENGSASANFTIMLYWIIIQVSYLTDYYYSNFIYYS